MNEGVKKRKQKKSKKANNYIHQEKLSREAKRERKGKEMRRDEER